MNFLLRTAQPSVPDQPAVQEIPTLPHPLPKTATTLEGLIAEDSDPPPPSNEDGDESGGFSGESNGLSSRSTKNRFPIVENHSDVTEDEGWITIPYKELPDNWTDAPNIHSLCPLDRSFVFPGEQVHILVCLSTAKQDTEHITPFRIAAAMSKNGIPHAKQRESTGTESDSVIGKEEEVSPTRDVEQNADTLLTTLKIDPEGDISASESLLRMEDHKRHTETLLGKFKDSHFFVRITETDEPLWSKRSDPESSETAGGKLTANGAGVKKTLKKDTHVNAVIDRGNFDAFASGGLARDTVRCCSLSNGDIVVLLGVLVGVDVLKNPTLEVLQFEKHQDENLASDNGDNLIYTNLEDPCRELLDWLLPLDRSLPPARSPPHLGNTSGFGSASQKSNNSASSGSQLFSFGHFRSYSMSSLPPSSLAPPLSSVTSSNSKPTFDLENWGLFSAQKLRRTQETGTEELLSFRGVSLEPERFSVHCGLEGIYIPGRRWRRKLEIIQPVEIHSFAADCNTEDLLCVQIKNVSPVHTPDIVIFLDAISIVFEEDPKGGTPLSLPIACIEAGNDHSLPNVALRRGEEHSFILKPVPMWKNRKIHGGKSTQPSPIQVGKVGSAASKRQLPSKAVKGRGINSSADQYAVLLSCRCNYSESRLFFKKPIAWRPCLTRDLIISVASEMSEKRCGSNKGVDQLPVQVLTLQASNLTSEDLTLTVLAPASFTSPTVASLNSGPSSPMSPFVGFYEVGGRLEGDRHSSGVERLSSTPVVSENKKESAGTGARSVSFDEQNLSDVIPSTEPGCTHLWLQSRAPLGCVPSQSTATVKLELLPLTDGIITLDTLQIDVKEKGLTWIPEHSLMINATSSIATGIV
ncbi:hypothetical protein NE237_015398 [Protea cynaroides]|uniref:Uncharacterized protein n=1 Tax=Protea cynaroides TaxID=273540 RepID=A0A9Q0QR03_9MAGN|nr:hypothetical protein NE237_015398 [Protea cynaroides]